MRTLGCCWYRRQLNNIRATGPSMDLTDSTITPFFLCIEPEYYLAYTLQEYCEQVLMRYREAKLFTKLIKHEPHA